MDNKQYVVVVKFNNGSQSYVSGKGFTTDVRAASKYNSKPDTRTHARRILGMSWPGNIIPTQVSHEEIFS